MKRKLIAFLLAAIALISLTGINVFAAEEDEACPLTIKSAVFDKENSALKIEIANTSLEDVILINQLEYNENELVLAGQNNEIYVQQGTMISAGKSSVFTYHVDSYEADVPAVNMIVQYYYSNSEGLDYDSIIPNQYYFEDVLSEKVMTPVEAIKNFLSQTAFALFAADPKKLIMIAIAFFLAYLAIGRGYEPLLLLPIAFGMLLTNLPGAEMFHEELFANGHAHWNLFNAPDGITPGLLDYLYLGVKLSIYPCLIFMGVGAMTDFGPLIANPKSLLLGAAAQLGIFVTYVGARYLGFTPAEASSIGIIGGADGPTAIYVTTRLAPHLLGPIAVAAYSYMALVPVIQPPIMKLLTTKKERQIVMKPLREVSKKEKIIFPFVVTAFVACLVPSAAPLVGCLMLGNIFKESGAVDRLSKTAQNELCNIVTIFLGTTVGATATANTFLSLGTLKIIAMGVVAFGLGTAGGVLLAKFMNLFLKEKINPLIGSAGVSAVPMAARVSQVVGQKENPKNFLLMHAMGPNVAGVIGSAIAAGVLLSMK